MSTRDVRLAGAFDVVAGAALAAVLVAREAALPGACLGGALLVAGVLVALHVRMAALAMAVAYFGVGVFVALGTAVELIEWRRAIGYGLFAGCSVGAYLSLRAWSVLRPDRETAGRAGRAMAGR